MSRRWCGIACETCGKPAVGMVEDQTLRAEYFCRQCGMDRSYGPLTLDACETYLSEPCWNALPNADAPLVGHQAGSQVAHGPLMSGSLDTQQETSCE